MSEACWGQAQTGTQSKPGEAWESSYEREAGRSELERPEDATPLALRIEEGATRRGMPQPLQAGRNTALPAA